MNNGIIGFPTPHTHRSEEQVLVLNAYNAFSLPLATAPDHVTVRLRCITAEVGYVPGDIVLTTPRAYQAIIKVDGRVTVFVATGPTILDLTNGLLATPTAANWLLSVVVTWGTP